MIRTTVRYKGIQYDWAVLLCGVSFSVSFSVSLLVSPVVSSYIVSSRSSRCIVSWGGAVLIIVRSVILLYRHRPCVVPPRSSRLAMRRNGTTCVSIPCRRASCAVSLSHSLRLVPVRLRSSSFVVVGMGVSLRGACGEIELTKTAHFNALVISVSSCSCSCSCCVAMGIGPGRTGVRQGTGAGLFGRSFCRICPQAVSAN